MLLMFVWAFVAVLFYLFMCAVLLFWPNLSGMQDEEDFENVLLIVTASLWPASIPIFSIIAAFCGLMKLSSLFRATLRSTIRNMVKE